MSRLSAVLADAAALSAAWVGVIELRSVLVSPALPPLPPEILLPVGGLLVPLGLVALATTGAYTRRPAANHILRAVGLALVGSLVLLFLARISVNRSVLLGFAVTSIPALFVSRAVRRRPDPLRIVIVGEADPTAALVRHLAGRPEVQVAAVLSPDDVPALALACEHADEVHVAGVLSTDLLGQIAETCDTRGVPLSLDANFLGLRTTSAELLDVHGWTAVTFRPGSDGSLDRLAKRVLDVVGGLAGLILVGPVIGLLALAVRLQDGGPALFHQRRIGRFGRPFTIHKLRTMTVDAEARPVVGTKPRNDPRITPIGRVLRRLSLDELPQLWNVVRGEMSLVGPRPPLPSEVARYERWQWRRLSVRPGMTGLWQVSGRADLPVERWVELDLEYVDGWSLWVDLRLLARTVPAVISGTGAR